MASKQTEYAVAALDTAKGDVLIIRSYPSKRSVQNCIKEHNRRSTKGEPAGKIMGGLDYNAHEIISANFYADENEVGDGTKAIAIELPATPKSTKSAKVTDES